MTNAARPTWSAALGAAQAPTFQYSSKDLKSHSKLKLRSFGQDAPEEVRQRDLRAELSLLEAKARGDEPVRVPAQDEIRVDETVDDDKISVSSQEPIDDDEDDTEALLLELEKIKKEREAERRRREEMEQLERTQNAISGNPLLSMGGNAAQPAFSVRRRWDDDVVFKNQASGVDDKPQKRFINDTTRSDFHKKFLFRYVR